MTGIDRVADRLLRRAARRWPAELRDEMYAEWAAERHVIAHQPSVSATKRAWSQLRFAASLATSRPPRPDGSAGVPDPREAIPLLGHRLRPLAALFGAGVVVKAGTEPIRQSGGYLSGLLGVGGTTGLGVAAGAVTVVLIGIAAWLGVVAGRRLPIGRRPVTRGGRVWTVVAAPIAAGAGFAVVEAYQSTRTMGVVPYPAVDAPLWIVSMSVLLLGVVWCARRFSPRAAGWAGAVGALVLLEMLAAGIARLIDVDARFAAPGLFPKALLSLDGTFGAAPGIGRIAVALPPLAVITAFLLAHGIRSSRVVGAAAPLRYGPIADSRMDSSARERFAVIALIVGGLTWAAGIGFATPAADRIAVEGHTQFLLWTAELRLAAILLTTLALGLGLAMRGRPMLPMAAAGTALLTTDTWLDAAGRDGLGGAVLAAVAVLVIVVAAGWLGRTGQHAHPPRDIPARRAFAGIGMVAAICAAIPLFQATSPPSIADSGGSVATTPAVFPVLTATVTAVLALLAVIAIGAAVRPRPRRSLTIAALVVPAGLFAAVGAVAGTPGWGVAGQITGLVAGLPFGAGVIIAGCVGTETSTRRRKRAVAIVLAWSAVLSVPVLFGEMTLSMVLQEPLMSLAGTGYPADGTGLLPGTVVVAILLAARAVNALFPKPVSHAVALAPAKA